MKKIQLLLFCVFSFLLLPLNLHAQNEIDRERISLEGLQEFGFTANIEGSRTIADAEELTPTVIRQGVINQLVNANLRYVADEEVQSSADIPFLYMHINAMEMENGLIPFSIELRLYQPVKLVLNRDLKTSASTWESGMVGLVSHDRLTVINQAAQSLVATFIDDYHSSNRNRRRN